MPPKKVTKSNTKGSDRAERVVDDSVIPGYSGTYTETLDRLDRVFALVRLGYSECLRNGPLVTPGSLDALVNNAKRLVDRIYE